MNPVEGIRVVAIGIAVGSLPLYWMSRNKTSQEAMIIRAISTISFWLALGITAATFLF